MPGGERGASQRTQCCAQAAQARGRDSAETSRQHSANAPAHEIE